MDEIVGWMRSGDGWDRW